MAGSRGALVVFGSGPGIGRNVAAVFAERGFQKIILLSRNETRLSQDADFVRAASAGASVDVIEYDGANMESVRAGLEEVEKIMGDVPLECVLFNHARLGPSKFFEFTVEELEIDLQVSVISLYAVAKWAMPKLLGTAELSDTKTPSFIVTSGMLAKDPFPAMFSLAACKAGQYNLVHSLHKEYEPKGVHCALVVVGGTVDEKMSVTNPRNIAQEIFELCGRPQGKGQLELVLMDPEYQKHIQRREQGGK
ncbi:NAD(P)-binding protein, partial [Aureobasidium melanogenum]